MANIQKLPSGRFRALVRRKGLPALSHTFPSREEALIWGAQMDMAVTNGSLQEAFDDASIPTVTELLERYMREVVPLHKGAKSEIWRIKKFQEAEFATFKVTEVKSMHIAEYRDARLMATWRGKLITSPTVRRELGILETFFNRVIGEWGYGEKYNMRNPCDLVNKPKHGKSRDRILSDEEYSFIINEAAKSKNPELAAIIDIALITAMRLSEILSLRWKHIVINHEKRIYIAHLPDSKNGKARDVPLDEKAVAALESLHGKDGKTFHYTDDGFKTVWGRLKRRAKENYEIDIRERGLPLDPQFLENLHFHDSRHTATTRLIQEFNGDVITTAMITGHKDLKMLLLYTHPSAVEIARRMRVKT